MNDTHESESPVGLLRRCRGSLWALAAGNLAVWAAMMEVQTVEKPFRNYLFAFLLNGGHVAHFVMLGIVAALVPQRPIVGLVAVIGCTLEYGYVKQACGGSIDGFAGLNEGLQTLPVLAIVQGLRLFKGWRLTTQPLARGYGSGQFPLSELLEWTTSICVMLGCVALFNLFFPDNAFGASLTIDYLLYFAQCLLLGVPVALVILAEKSPSRWTILALVHWCALVAVALFLADLRHRSMTLWILLAMVPRSFAPYLAAFFAVIIVNALILHLLGYRWRSPSSVSAL